MVDIIIFGLITVSLFFSIKHIVKSKKSGAGCVGCSGCSDLNKKTCPSEHLEK